MAEQKLLTLRKKINGVMCELMVKTVSDQVYIDEYTTLTMALEDLNRAIAMKANVTQLTELEKKFNALMQDAPETFDTLKEIADYIDSHQIDYEQIVSIAANKVDKEEGKGLSSNDFTDDLYNKLDELYTKVVLDQKFDQIDTEITNINRTIEDHTQTIAQHTTAISDYNTRIENIEQGAVALPGGFHIVDTIEERDALKDYEDGRLMIPGMLCYVRGNDTTYQLQDDKETWEIYKAQLTDDNMTQILNYVNQNLSDRSVYSVEEGVEYLTLY